MARLSSFIIKAFFLTTIFSNAVTTKQKRQDLFVKAMDAFRAASDGMVHVHKPLRTNRKGGFVDFVTLEPMSSISDDGKLRRRRSLTPRDVREKLNPGSTLDDGNHEVFFDLGLATGSPLSGARLQLRRNYRLVSENFAVEERSHGGKIKRRHRLVHECHYTGVIHNHDSFSKVALSVCSGLQGIIHKDDDTYFIEPLWNHTETFASPEDAVEEASSHPHTIVKRSALQHLNSRRKNKDDLGHCGYSDKVRGDMPWWRIDPRKPEQSQNSDADEEQSATIDENRATSGHHRSTSGRSRASETASSRKRRDVDAKSRRRRSVSRERSVETLVVADKLLVGFHGVREVEKYILTIMNIVASLYHDASIGNAVNVVVTRIVLLTEDQPDLQISHHADQSLNSFCRWQRSINVNSSSDASDSGLARHDNAVLLTGFDICTFKDEPCGTLGLAPVAGMCGSERSCNINEDTGLSSAFTIAHEIGHNFGMQHDGNGNECGPDSGSPSLIMAPQLTKNTSPYTWSGCSRDYITRFLDSGSGDCLLDTPPMRDFAYPEEMPGQMHDAEEQCRFQYGPGSRQCKVGNVCRELWCLTESDRCITNSVPAAEGTSCSTDSVLRGWCYRGNCVSFGFRPQAVDGGWGEWTAWAECSRSCGSGISTSSRICDNPAPDHGGRYCIGERRRYRICNSEACPSPERDFRSEQCSHFDNEAFLGKYYNWLPFVGGHQSKPCALSCLAQGYNFYAERAPAVVDGTRCSANALDICISGECHHVGCDNVLHSEAIEDKCRVCGGDGSSCQTEAGVFDDVVPHGRYYDVVTIPSGSVNIFIEEVENTQQNYVAMRSVFGTNYINGGWTLDWPRKFKIAGTTFNYQRPLNTPETLQALGPTNEDLVIMVLLQEQNRGIKYEYNVPVERNSSVASESAFLWEHDQWSDCSASCAGGMQRRPVVCRRVDDDTIVQSSYCDSNTMPSERRQTCNVEPCPARWNTGPWSSCSLTCGGGHRTRTVVCVRKLTQTEDEIVSGRYCTSQRPRISDRCNTETCPAVWRSSRWTSCSVSCGSGVKTREVTCMSSDRRVRYTNETACDALLKPSTRVRCNHRACPRSVWKVTRWSACSSKCIKSRRVYCVYQRNFRHSSKCPLSRKPERTTSCQACSSASSRRQNKSAEQCIDDPTVHYCPLVRRFKFCKREYFRKICCRTCSR